MKLSEIMKKYCDFDDTGYTYTVNDHLVLTFVCHGDIVEQIYIEVWDKNGYSTFIWLEDEFPLKKVKKHLQFRKLHTPLREMQSVIEKLLLNERLSVSLEDKFEEKK